MDVHALGWIALAAIILTMITIDVVGHVRTPHEPSMREAAAWSAAYIAMACAMSSVCHSSEDNRDNLGLGIILFDEAFNALDGGNVNSCLALLREFNLQVFACAPIEKLGVFMEQMDTVLSVRRIGTTTMLYADYLKDEGRAKFREANPANEPFDLFKERFGEEAVS